MADPIRVRQENLEVSEQYSTPNWPRSLIMETDANVVLESRAPGGTVSGWHHHGNRDVYVHVTEGRMTVEFLDGPTGETRAGTYTYYESDNSIHRYIVPDEVEEFVAILNLVGNGPVVVNVDDPAATD